MIIKRPSTLATGAGLILAISCAAIPASVSYAAELVTAPILAYDMTVTAPSDTPPSSVVETGTQLQSPASDAPQSLSVAATDVDPASVECMAKVVLHEAGNQPRAGKIAVAQTLVHRLNAGRFGDSICEVVNQKGQYFHIASFRPRHDSDGWQDAVEVSHAVLAGETEEVAPGAMFFHANYAPTNAFFRTRHRVTTVGAHIFYR